MRRVLFTLLLLASLDHSALAQEPRACTRHFLFRTGGWTVVEGFTRRDVICTINYGRVSDIVNYRLVTRPANGVLGSAGHGGGRYRTAYRPNPGFVGRDMFEADIEWRSRDSGRVFTARVRINMTVSP